MADWYPTTLAALGPWHVNYNIQVQATGTTLGLSAGQKGQTADNTDTVIQILNNAETVTAFAQAVTEWRNIILTGDMTAPAPPYPTLPTAPVFDGVVIQGIEEYTRMTAGIVRADPEFTQAIGEIYGIVAPAAGGAGTPAVAAVALTASQVQLTITKAGYQVLAIDGRINGGAWAQIGIAQVAQFTDSRSPVVPATPEHREYRVQGMVNNARTGPMSAINGVWTVP